MEPELLEMPMPAPEDLKMKVMSNGHKMLTERAFNDQACMIYTTPDTVFSDGYVDEIQRLVSQGKKLVLFPTGRYDLDGVIDALSGYDNDAAITLAPRDAVAIGLRNMHSCLVAANWESRCFWNFPIYCYWPVPGEDGVIFYTFNWFFVLIDYSVIENHDSSSLNEWTIDGNYYEQNFGHLCDQIYIINDSDRLMILPLTQKGEAEVSLKSHWFKYAPVIGELFKGFYLGNIYHHELIDSLKRKIYCTPVRFHSHDITPQWQEVEQLSRATHRKYIDAEDEGGDKLCVNWARNPRYVIFRMMRFIYNWSLPRYCAAYTRVIFLAVLGNKMEQKRVMCRLQKSITKIISVFNK